MKAFITDNILWLYKPLTSGLNSIEMNYIFVSNMTRQMTLWYGRDEALFKQLAKDHPRVEMTKVGAG